jgi:hypothetical protein
MAGCTPHDGGGSVPPGNAEITVMMSALTSPYDPLPPPETFEAGLERARLRLVDVWGRAERAAPGSIACHRAYLEYGIRDMLANPPESGSAGDADLYRSFVRIFRNGWEANVLAGGGDPRDPKWDPQLGLAD